MSSIFQVLIITYTINFKIHYFIGDEIPKKDCTDLLDELIPPGSEDEDGFFAYMPFLDKLCGKA